MAGIASYPIASGPIAGAGSSPPVPHTFYVEPFGGTSEVFTPRLGMAYVAVPIESTLHMYRVVMFDGTSDVGTPICTFPHFQYAMAHPHDNQAAVPGVCPPCDPCPVPVPPEAGRGGPH